MTNRQIGLLLVASALVTHAVPARASLTLSTGLGATHAGNLVANGSFESGAPPDGIPNELYWATGTGNTPLSVPPSWTSSGAAPSYALWGNEATLPESIQGSDGFPDGRAGLYFGNGAPVFVNQQPTFNANGTVSFPATPNFVNNYSPSPVILSQTINTPATPAPSYKLSFWVSGEGAVYGQQFTERGIFGMQMTNVLAGDPIQWLTVPNGTLASGFGVSHLYEYTFTPLNTLQPVKINFINWGHFDLSAYSMSNFTTELVLDDVIVNATPEPSSVLLAGIGLIGLLGYARRMRKRTTTSPSQSTAAGSSSKVHSPCKATTRQQGVLQGDYREAAGELRAI